MKLTAVKALLVVLCFATMRSTAGPIQLMVRDEGSATDVQSQIDKSFDKNISTTAITKEEQGTGLKNSPSFDNVSSSNKLASDIALVETATDEVNSSLIDLNSENNLTKKKVDDYYEDFEAPPDELEHTSQELTTTTEKVVHNIKPPKKTSYDQDSNESNEIFHSEEEGSKKRNKKLEETRSATYVPSQIHKSLDKNILTTATTKEEQGTGLKNLSSFDNVTSTNKLTSDIASVDTATDEVNSSLIDLNSENNLIKKKVDDYKDYEAPPDELEHTTQELTTTTEKVVHNIKQPPNKTLFDHDSNDSNEIFHSEEEESKKSNKKLEETRSATNVSSQIHKSYDKNISTTATTKEEQGTGLKNPSSFDNVTSTNILASNIASVDTATDEVNSSLIDLNSENNLIKKKVDDYYEDFEAPPDELEHTTQELTTTTEKVVHSIKPPNKTLFDHDSNDSNETFHSEEEESKKRNKKFEETRSPPNVQPRAHDAIEKGISTTLVKTKEKEVSAYETTTHLIVLVGTTTNQSYTGPTKVLDSAKDKNKEDDVEYEDNTVHTNVQPHTDRAIEKEMATITVEATEGKVKSAYDNNNRSLADGIYSSVYNKTGDNDVFDSKNDTSKEREQNIYEDYEVHTDGQILTVTTTREEIVYNISSAGKSSSNYEPSNSKENLNSEENEGKKQILEEKRQPTNDDLSPYNKTSDNTVSVGSITTQGHIDYVDYTSLTDQMNDNSAYLTHPVDNPSDSNQEQIGFVPLENNTAVGTQNWDGNLYETATNVPVKSSASEEHGKMLQKPSSSNIKTDEKQTDYNDYFVDSEEYEKKFRKPSNSKRKNDGNEYDYVDFDLQDASNDPNTGNSDEKLNEVPVTKNTLLDSLKNYINQNGLNIDDIKRMINNPAPNDPTNTFLQDYNMPSKNKKFGTYSEQKANKNPYGMYLENVNSNLIQSLYRY